MAGRRKKDGDSPNTINEHQRLALLEWLAEGCSNAEINNRAGAYTHTHENGAAEYMPFAVSAQSLYAYRNRYEARLVELRKEKENIALNSGLAVKANRIAKLEALAALLEDDLHEKKLVWTEDAKTVGKERYDFYQFNRSEIEQLRGIYDDIAKETGGRVVRTDITTKDKPIKGYVTVSPEAWDKKVTEQSKHD